MKYFVLSADYLRPSLQNEATREDEISGAGLSEEILGRVREWNAKYQEVIPLSMEARRSASELIDRLDRVGLDLAGQIRLELGETKVRYYSEGLLEYLS